MLWNWQVVDSCFLSESWHVRSRGAFAASCIGVVALAACVEAVKHWSTVYDAQVCASLRAADARRLDALALEDDGDVGLTTAQRQRRHRHRRMLRATPFQQLVRTALAVTLQGGFYVLMLIAMAFNGYIVVCILLGTALGKFLGDWLQIDPDDADYAAKHEH